jgi:hypothetical protein
MDFGVSLACALGVAPRVKRVAMRDVGMVRRLLVHAGLVEFGGFQMMVRCLTMVLGGKLVMFDRLVDFDI